MTAKMNTLLAPRLRGFAQVRCCIAAVQSVMALETGDRVAISEMHMDRTITLSGGVSTMIALAGDVGGMALLDLPNETAVGFASHVSGRPFTEPDDLVRSALAELANVAMGQAVTRMSDEGWEVTISPPTLLTHGAGEMWFPSLPGPVVRVKLDTVCGQAHLQVALGVNAWEPSTTTALRDQPVPVAS